MNNDDLIYRMPDGDLDEAECRQLNNLIESDTKAREDVFAYMVLESELIAKYTKPFRFKLPESARPSLFIMRNRFVLAAAASLLIAVVGTLIVFHQPVKPLVQEDKAEWRLAIIKDVRIDASAPVQLIGNDGQKGESVGGYGRAGEKDNEKELLNAISFFSAQFGFEVMLPKNLPEGFVFLRAMRIEPSSDTDNTETALIIYKSPNKNIFIFEDKNTGNIDSIPKDITANSQWHQKTYNNLRITMIGIGFTAEYWKTLIESINF
ncbi:MAG: hypothetical protein HY811_00395 [Planctomycetes bacterium]|nr:hypothetical protein [Planctomycetota bacterium]